MPSVPRMIDLLPLPYHSVPAAFRCPLATRFEPILRSGCRLEQPHDLFLAQHQRYFARLAHERKVPSHLCPTDGHAEEEPQRRNRAVDGRRTHAASAVKESQLSCGRLQLQLLTLRGCAHHHGCHAFWIVLKAKNVSGSLPGFPHW
jgi:hypothetical protein